MLKIARLLSRLRSYSDSEGIFKSPGGSLSRSTALLYWFLTQHEAPQPPALRLQHHTRSEDRQLTHAIQVRIGLGRTCSDLVRLGAR